MNINASLFVQMVVFFLGAWVTMKYIWPPLIHAIEERQKKIADGLAAANKGEKALAVATEQGKAIEAEARTRASTIVADGEKRAQSILDEAKAQAQVEAERILEAAKVEAASEVQRIREQLRENTKKTGRMLCTPKVGQTFGGAYFYGKKRKQAEKV